MKKWTQNEINEAVRLHGLWIICDKKGVRANLSGANLSEANGVKRCSADWDGHGECGRKLTAVLIGKEDRYFCGCFAGTLEELREYIAKGKEKYRSSRTKVADFVASCMSEETT